MIYKVLNVFDRLPLLYLNPIALRKAKIVYNFGLSECNRVNIPTLVFVTPVMSQLTQYASHCG